MWYFNCLWNKAQMLQPQHLKYIAPSSQSHFGLVFCFCDISTALDIKLKSSKSYMLECSTWCNLLLKMLLSSVIKHVIFQASCRPEIIFTRLTNPHPENGFSPVWLSGKTIKYPSHLKTFSGAELHIRWPYKELKGLKLGLGLYESLYATFQLCASSVLLLT